MRASRSGPIGCAALVVLLAAALAPLSVHAQLAGAPPDSAATVSGVVVEQGSGAPLPGAEVSLAGGPATRGVGTRVTDERGAFRFEEVPPGTYMLRVELIGYRTRADTLSVEPGADLHVVASMGVSPVPLEPLLVMARRADASAVLGFDERRARGIGSFMTHEQIERRAPHRVADLFRSVPGAQVVPAGAWGHDLRLRGGCRPDLWIDGVRTTGTAPLDFVLSPHELEAIELYRSSEVPVQFGASPCGVVVAWTRVPKAGDHPEGFLKRVGLATLVALVVVLLAR